MQYRGMKKQRFTLGVLLALCIIASPLMAGGITPPPGLSQAAADGLYVNRAGDTGMTGTHDWSLAEALFAAATKGAHPVTRDFGDGRYPLLAASNIFAGTNTFNGNVTLGGGGIDILTIKAGVLVTPSSFTWDATAAALKIDASGQLFEIFAATLDLSGAGDIPVPDGSKAAPSLRGSDTDSGIHFGSGGKSPSVTVDGSDVLVCDSTGVEVVGNAKVSGDLTDGTKSLSVAEAEAAFVHSGVTPGNPHNVAKADVGLGNVEDIALSTWGGSFSITKVGTVTKGTWEGATVAISAGGTGELTAAAAFSALSPLTSKGDLHGYSTTDERLGVGSTGQFLTVIGLPSPTALGWVDLPIRSPITIAFGGGENIPYFTTTNATFTTAAIFPFLGTDALGTPSKVWVIGNKSVNPTAWDFQLIDLTNATTIVTKTGNTGTTAELVDAGATSNWPTGIAMLEIQFRRTGGSPANGVFGYSAGIEF
jgi:hypothetical protein